MNLMILESKMYFTKDVWICIKIVKRIDKVKEKKKKKKCKIPRNV